MLKKLIHKILLLLVVLVGLNFIYEFTLYQSDFKKLSPCAYQCKKLPPGIDIVYFGESSNYSFEKTDSTKLSISELINYFEPRLKIITIDTFAVHAGIYKYWIKEMENNLPKAILVTLNMRSFDAAWINSKLETPLIRSVRLLKNSPKLMNRFLMSLKNPEDKTEKERDQLIQKDWRTTRLIFPTKVKYQTVRQWDNAMANGGWLNADGSWDMGKIGLAAHYIKGYAFNISDQNPRIKDFDEIVEWGLKHKVKVYFNLLAENVAQADSLVGKDLVFLMKNNRDYLINRFTKRGAIVIDNLESVSMNDFIDKTWPTEHYNCIGRIAIAKKIVLKLNMK